MTPTWNFFSPLYLLFLPRPSSLQVTQSIFNFRPLWFECVLCIFLTGDGQTRKHLCAPPLRALAKKRITSSFSAFEILNALPANYLFPLVNSQRSTCSNPSADLFLSGSSFLYWLFQQRKKKKKFAEAVCSQKGNSKRSRLSKVGGQ